GFGGRFFGCLGGCLRHGRKLRIFARNYSLDRRISACFPTVISRQIGSRETYSAACNTAPGFFGAIQNASGRSNRKLACTASAARQISSAPATPATVTISETVPISAITPVFSSSVRVAAIGRKNAR